MTLLVSWGSVDPHGPTAVYIAADSRISWGTAARFDYGRKVFAFRNHPDIVGYCGDVLFPSMVIGQLIELGDNGLLFGTASSSKERFEAFKEKLVQQCHRYPRENLADQMFQVLYASRQSARPPAFFCHLIEWSKAKGWRGEDIAFPDKSGVLKALGSGASGFSPRFAKYEMGPTKKTSRAVFHCFCNSLFSGEDPMCGGAPQLVGIYRKPNSSAIPYGIIREKKRYLFGSEIEKLPSYESVEWRNDLFERCDGATMKRLPGAQEQPDTLRSS